VNKRELLPPQIIFTPGKEKKKEEEKERKK